MVSQNDDFVASQDENQRKNCKTFQTKSINTVGASLQGCKNHQRKQNDQLLLFSRKMRR